jgi:hypothetical protein
MEEFVKILPSWMGTVPQWIIVGSLILALIKIIPIMRQQNIDSNRTTIGTLITRIDVLRQEVKDCRELCDEDTGKLKEEIHGLRTQRLAEQATLMRAILRTSNDPEVRKQLEILEAMQASLAVAAVSYKGADDGNDIEGA